MTYCEKITGVSYRHAWSVGGEMYLKKAKAWADAYYKSPCYEYIMVLGNSDQPASPTTLSDKSPPDSPQSSTSVFRVGLVELPTTKWGSHCSQGVHMMH